MRASSRRSHHSAVVRLVARCCAGEVAAQNRARGFQAQQGFLDISRRKPEPVCQRLRGHRTAVHHPAGHHSEQGVVARRRARRQLRRRDFELRVREDQREILGPFGRDDVTTAHQSARAQRASLPAARRGTESSSKPASCQSASAISSGTATRVCSVSCSSSLSRTSGRASSRTRAIAV